jgi:transposase, IS30 family
MYTQLTEGQRYQISVLLRNDFTKASIARQIGVHPSTIGRELCRNTGERGYRQKQAHEKALERRHHSEKQFKMTGELTKIIVMYLKEDWSPEQISGYLKENGNDWVSHETIYQFILDEKANGGVLYKHLRHSGKKRKKRYGGSDRRGEIKNRVSIDKRPKSIEKRTRIGDWEIDLVIGQNHQRALVTIVDRLSLKTLIAKVERKQSDLVSHATIQLLLPYKNYATHTITADNGKEFSEHEFISKKLKADFYFAHPYSSWERGTNENTNGLIRQYFPKKTSFEKITEKDLEFVMDRLNNRPRKCLGYRTPNQVFNEYLN